MGWVREGERVERRSARSWRMYDYDDGNVSILDDCFV